jgi:short-subunit dehydrogenase
MMKNVGLVTGASSGIGLELARIHAANGRDLVLVARREEVLNALKKELETSHGIQVLVLAEDLMQPGAAKRIVDALHQQQIHVEYLFNNAGLGGYGKFVHRNLVDEQKMIQLNIIALTELTHLLLPAMVEKQRGFILNTASSAGFMPGPLQSVYFATKAFVVSFSQGISRELKGTGVRVSALCPGPVKTGFEKAAGFHESPLFDKAKDAHSTAKKGYVGMEKGKLLVFNEFPLRFAINWVLPLVPRKTVAWMVQRLQTVN